MTYAPAWAHASIEVITMRSDGVRFTLGAHAAMGFGLLFALAAVSAAQAPVQISEFPVGGNPIPLVVGADGNFWTWFSGGTSVGRITPVGAVTVFQTPLPFPASTPGHCVDTRDGYVWCSNTGGDLVRVAVVDGSSAVFSLPSGTGATDLTFGPDGALWFTDFAQNRIGRMTLQGAVTEYPVPAAFVAPRSITVGPDGALWFIGDDAQVGRMDVTGGGFRYYNLPQFPANSAATTSAIRTGPDGNLWLGVTALIGRSPMIRLTPDGVVTQFPLLNASDAVLDVVAGPDGAMWFTMEEGNRIGRITTSGAIAEYDLQPGSGPVGIAVGWDRAIWFTELAGRLGRISGGPLAAAAIPTLSPALLVVFAGLLAMAGWLGLR